jgi:4-amino-4-deoxy-L-arabinose transferase-like glycosyltransferase/putative flippase GtrA
MKDLALIGRSRLAAAPRLFTMGKFLAVGLSGVVVNELVYVGLVHRLAIWFVVAAILSTEVSTTWNFLGNELWAFSGRKFHGHPVARYISYAGMNNAMLLLRVPMLWLLSDIGHMGPASANLVALGALFVLRFAVSDGWVWRKKVASQFDAVDADGNPEPQFRYDIGGLLRLDSDSELPELAYFRTVEVTPPDIRIRTHRIAALPAARIKLKRDGERITYREHLGVLGADFNVTLGHPIEVEASHLLSLSRHVLYTNVIEALLRFVLVSKGYVLLHSAGLEVDGKATLLSAQTDTGKTSTVINMVRERHWRFISDDMAIIDPAGFVRTFPKPMTLSYHTMTRAVDASTLSPRKRMQLQVQSRVHSKSGRTVGKGLGTLNVPIMSINSVLQIMVPPPKYHITSLLPAHIATESPIANVFLMERGEPIQERVEPAAAIDQLIENTDDAYGFPPFATLAPHFMIDGLDYQQLRARERELLTQALQNVTVWRLRVRGHEWGELLPRLIEGGEEPNSIGIPIEPEEREPVGIPIETGSRDFVGVPIEAEATAAATVYQPTARARSKSAGASPDNSPAFLGSGSSGVGRVATPAVAEVSLFAAGTYGRKSKERLRRASSAASGLDPGAAGPGSPGPAAVANAVAINPYPAYPLVGGLAIPSGLSATRERLAYRLRVDARLWIALGAILLVAAGVRLWAIGATGFNNDEAVYAGQGASLAGDPAYTGLFSIFRAHPLLTQFLYSISFRFIGVNDIAPRLISVAFGLGGVALAYSTGSLLYGRRAGLIASAILAFMPYHVIVTRQALLDGPETTLFLLSIYLLSRYAREGESRWLYGAAFATGLTVLAKETAVLIVPVAIAFLLLTPEIKVSLRRQLVAIGLFVAAVAPYPFAILIGKGTGAAQSFVLWEVLRQPNHTWSFYADVLPTAMGPLVFIAGAAGLLYAVRRARWQDRLLISWVAVPIAFFEIWPVKGYQYLLPIAPAVAILAGMGFDRLLKAGESIAAVPSDDAAGDTDSTDDGTGAPSWRRSRLAGRLPRLNLNVPRPIAMGMAAALLAGTIASIGIPTVLAVNSTSISGSLAGTGGLPGGRETGLWIEENVPEGGVFLTTGPTLANIIEFYGQRKAYGLSVSPNPLRRNPAYDPILNPDRSLQLNKIQYIATDIWSAQRSPFFDALLKRYIARYHGVLVYKQEAEVLDSSGKTSTQVVIQIYAVRP